jgi:hypothetical protein
MSLEARSQPAPSPVVGFLSIGSPSKWVPLVAAFRGGLNEAGYRDGGNVRIEFRWAEGQDDRLAILAAELVRERVNVLVATGGPRSVLAAKGCDIENSHSLHARRRPRQARCCCHSRATWIKYHWRDLHYRPAECEAA